MKESFFKFLNFIRLVDGDNVLSLTHIALWTCIIKIALVSSTSVADMGALLIAILSYGYKKWLGAQTPQNVVYAPEFQQKFEDLELKIKEAQGKLSAVAMNQALAPNGFNNGVKRS